MSEKTGIQWTDHTFNPWWGCAHVSPGCVNCYAETLAARYGNDVWGAKAPRRFFGEKHWAEPLKWNREAEREGRRHRVFCASMADVFEPREDLDLWREALWALIDATPSLDWQLLTKRPEEVAGMVPWGDDWPANVWLGTSVENQEWADKRIPELLKIPARLRFLSCEPLVGPTWILSYLLHGQVDWVIIGGESGPHARRMDLMWARSLVNQCRKGSRSLSRVFRVPGALIVGEGVVRVSSPAAAVFVKQLGAAYRQRGDSHGADMTYWPEELRVRQMPASVVVL